MDYSRFLAPLSARRQPSAIRSLQRFLDVPGMISLGGGNPHPSTFPFTGISFTTRDGRSISLGDAEVAKALQYSPTTGLPELVRVLKDLQTAEHSPPLEPSGIEVCVGNGSQDVLTKAFDMLLSGPEDTLMVEAPAYVGSLAFLRPLGCKFAEVAVDSDGLNPDSLQQLLENWSGPPEKRPKVLYTVPVGGNPTGASTTLARKKRIYALAQKYDFIILEDDPYYYLQIGDKIPSYFSMDVDGRILRFDSFSKILSAGVRIGWVTGPKALVDRIALHAQATILHTSGVSQMLVCKLMQEWGTDGFYSHVHSVAQFYEAKSKMFLESAEKHLKGLAEWSAPTAGMFVWIKLLGVTDSSALIREKAVEKKVLLVPGFEFYPNPRVTAYVRASFSTATREEIDVALQRLAEVITEEQQRKD